MIKKIGITITAIILLVACLFILTACFKKKDKGLEIGFSHNDRDVVENGIFVAIKSEKLVFDIDDVTIDLYYGTTATAFPFEPDERNELACIALEHKK